MAGGSDDDYTVHGMADLMLAEFLICIVPLALAVLFFQDAPPTPPSHSTQLKIEVSTSLCLLGGFYHLFIFFLECFVTQSSSKKNQKQPLITGDYNSFAEPSSSKSYEAAAATAESEDSQHAWEVFCAETAQLFRNRDYLLLFAAFSIGVGFFNSLLTLLNQIVEPFGYSNDDAGTFGAVFIVFGLVGAGSIGVFDEAHVLWLPLIDYHHSGTLMEKTKAYRPILKIGILFSLLSIVLFLAMLYSDNFWPLLVTFAIMGVPCNLLFHCCCADSVLPCSQASASCRCCR